MQILNRKNLDTWPPGSIYIGRGTPFGNPYVIGEHGDRDAVCDQYADRLAYRIAQGDPPTLTALLGLKADSSLVCSCAPLRCHGNEIEAAWCQIQEAGLPKRQPSMTYAGIGSRKAPLAQLERMTRAARRLAAMGTRCAPELPMVPTWPLRPALAKRRKSSCHGRSSTAARRHSYRHHETRWMSRQPSIPHGAGCLRQLKSSKPAIPTRSSARICGPVRLCDLLDAGRGRD